MFIAIVNYKVSIEEVERNLADHRRFLDENFAKGHIITSGPQLPRKGGVIMLSAPDIDAARALLADDPFNVRGIADYTIVEFTPTKFCTEALRGILCKD
ncbi:MAG: GTP cyclohydrolase [Bacteroides sp.]|nr:GTP cyclohydrolase [Bacteroides sp.]